MDIAYLGPQRAWLRTDGKAASCAGSSLTLLPPAATLTMLEVRGERKYEGNQPKVSYCFCQELNPELWHDRGPCDCLSRPHPFL
jgi:hypothetical protein